MCTKHVFVDFVFIPETLGISAAILVCSIVNQVSVLLANSGPTNCRIDMIVMKLCRFCIFHYMEKSTEHAVLDWIMDMYRSDGDL